jgi:protein gp37
MGDTTAITWCDHTFNAWEGCEKISPGCKNCYAASTNNWLHGGENWGPGSTRRFFGAAHWAKPLKWNTAAKRDGVRRRVFCSSIADVFEDRPELEQVRHSLWDLILMCADLDWLLLTKRPENFERLLAWGRLGAPFRNVWLGVTAEDQEHADRRIPILRATPAAMRFVSYEPALGAIDWTQHLVGDGRPDWVIFGDESGRKRRPAELAWARETRDACAAAGVAFHFKQWCGGDVDGLGGDRVKGKIHLPILDGVKHAEFPR